MDGVFSGARSRYRTIQKSALEYFNRLFDNRELTDHFSRLVNHFYNLLFHNTESTLINLSYFLWVDGSLRYSVFTQCVIATTQ